MCSGVVALLSIGEEDEVNDKIRGNRNRLGPANPKREPADSSNVSILNRTHNYSTSKMSLNVFLILLNIIFYSQASRLERQSSIVPPVSLEESPRIRTLTRETCSKLQHEVQKAIILHNWGFENLKFQQRLKRSPKYIVTIQVIRPQHEPIVELSCSQRGIKGLPSLEFAFHETRFTADSVRLFDINSIFPIHTGSMSVKLKLDTLVILLDKTSQDIRRPPNSNIPISINEVFFTRAADAGVFAKEHRDDGAEQLLDIEKEIETIFTGRIRPDVHNQVKNIVTETVKNYILTQNIIKF